MADKKTFCFRIYAPGDLNKKYFVWWRDNGKRHYKYADINKYPTHKKRIQRANQVIEELKESLQPTSASAIKQMYDWLETRVPFWKKKSISTYKSCLNEFALYAKGKAIDKKLVADFFEVKSGNWNNTTYNKYRCKLGRIFKAIGEGQLIEHIESVKEYRTPARYFQKHQVKRLKKHISSKDPQLWLFIEFVFYCFIRPGELRLLRYSDILFNENKILIRSEISKNRKSQYVVIPKPFIKKVNQLKHNTGYVFTHSKDVSKPIGVNTMSTRHRKIIRKLGFDHQYKLYSWKHTGAVMSVLEGVNLKELQIQLRHHSLDQVNEYLRQMGVFQMNGLRDNFPSL